ncbi:hypothetical protein [Novacetimonas hansenii]|nr:hypothetical protein [Novacetimonas hansenii]
MMPKGTTHKQPVDKNKNFGAVVRKNNVFRGFLKKYSPEPYADCQIIKQE